MQPRPLPISVFQSLSRRDKYLFVLFIAAHLSFGATVIYILLFDVLLPCL